MSLLTRGELAQIEGEIDGLNLQLEHPNLTDHEIDRIQHRLDTLLLKLNHSYRNTRMWELGIRLIQNESEI